jgi:hypothetical protein
MENAKPTLRVFLLTSLFSVRAIANAAEIATELADGWHSWEVPAGAAGAQSCCYHIGNGGVRTEGCRLGSGSAGITINGDCVTTSDTLRVYVRADGGDVVEIRALSAACPVVASGPVTETGTVDTAESIAWLLPYANNDSDIAEEAVTAIALHEDGSAFAALKPLIEDRGRVMDIRRHALFWLAHSGSEAAFEYLDRLLSAR